MKKSVTKPFITYGLLCLGLLGIALIYIHPLLPHFTTHTLGIDEDSGTHVWYLWWFKFAVFEGHTNPFVTNWIFYPQIIDRTFDIHTWTNALISLPFQYGINVVAASNLVFIISLLAAGVGAYTLTKRISGSIYGSLFASILFTFYPYIFAQAEDFHTNLTTVWFYPWYLYFLIRLIEKPTYKWAVASGIILGLQVLNDWTYSAFLLLSGPLLYLYYFITDRNKILRRRTITLLWIKFCVAVLVGAPMISAAIAAVNGGVDYSAPTWVQDYYGADIAWYLTPSTHNPLLTFAVRERHLSFIESSLFVGYTSLILILSAIVLKRKKLLQIKALLLPSILFLSYFVLSLGPDLHVFDSSRNLTSDFKPNLLMPFTYFQLLPLVGGIKEPARFAPFAMLGFSILAGFSLKALLDKQPKPLAISVTGLAILATVVEFYPGNVHITDLSPRSTYVQIQKDETTEAVLDIPLGLSSGNHSYGQSPIGSLQLFQAYHQKRILRGTVARVSPENVYFYKELPFFEYLANPIVDYTFKVNERENFSKWLKQHKVKYLIVHKPLIDTMVPNVTDPYEKKLLHQKIEGYLLDIPEMKKLAEDNTTSTFTSY